MAASNTKRKLGDLTVDEFLLSGFDSEAEGDSDGASPFVQNGKAKKSEKCAAGAQDKGMAAETKSENENGNGTLVKVTEKMVEEWKAAIKELTPLLFQDIAMAFKAAVAMARGEGGDACCFKVEDKSVLNALILLCISDVFAALQQMLRLRPGKEHKLVLPSSSPRWQKNQADIRMYLSGLVELLSCGMESTVISAILRHANQMVPYFLCVPKNCEQYLKQLIMHWSTGEDTVRVLSFLGISKICRHKQEAYLNPTLKQMYIAYVKNCKVTSPATLPTIDLMQRTLTEVYALDTQVSYRHAFFYIRQLAVHLREATTTKQKETCQSVYNWQFVHCLYLWCRVLGTLHPSEVLEPLIYPLCQVIVSCIKLVPTTQYYPLRLHCIRALTLLSKRTNTFVPVLPFLLEVFQQVDFNKNPGRVSAKPIDFAVILKLSNNQLQEKAFRDGLIEQLCELLLEYFHTQAWTIGFPELALPTIIQLKAFLKDCKVAHYCKQIRHLLEKLQENSAHVTGQRLRAAFGVAHTPAVGAWERQMAEEGTPLTKYYSQLKKVREKDALLEASGKERMRDLDLPEIKGKKLHEGKKKVDHKGLSNLDRDSVKCLEGKLQEQCMGEEVGELDDSDDEDGEYIVEEGSEDEGISDSLDCDEEEGGKSSPSLLKELVDGDEDMVDDLELTSED